MNTSGISLLASKLSQYRPPAVHESVKLSDSVTSSPYVRSPVVTPSFDSVDTIKEEMDHLIAQTSQQEQALLHFHTQLVHSTQREDYLRARLLYTTANAIRKRVLAHSLGRLRTRRQEPRIGAGMMIESVNLNETLRNLAMQLESPNGGNESSLLLSTSMPFSITRKHFRK